jgi:adenylosuccinate synthase
MTERAYVVTDISYGDAGKGTTVDYLVRQAASAVVVRHNGGAQAAHNVITAEGTHHTFAQFGSGSLVPNVRTHLSRFMVLNPLNMLYEGDALAGHAPDIWQRVTVDQDALVITPWQRAANQLRELARGAGRHGSCGLGVGETVSDSLYHPGHTIRVRDLFSGSLGYKLLKLRDFKLQQLRQDIDVDNLVDKPEWQVFNQAKPDLADLIASYQEWLDRVTVVDGDYLGVLADHHDLMVFEGAQGVLLDERYGFHPYTTWSKTTHQNASALLSEIGFRGEVTRLGVMRAYMTRHGAGPFVTEDSRLTAQLPDAHNGTGTWQGSFRVGYLDLVAHRYALSVSPGTDELVVTHLDRLSAVEPLQVCIGYRLPSAPPDADQFFEHDATGMVTAIKACLDKDLVRQARLTELLQSCTPVYQTVSAPAVTSHGTESHRERKLLALIEDSLGLPISITSSGPTAADKQALVAC